LWFGVWGWNCHPEFSFQHPILHIDGINHVKKIVDDVQTLVGEFLNKNSL
jgi:hypothetical protein